MAAGPEDASDVGAPGRVQVDSLIPLPAIQGGLHS